MKFINSIAKTFWRFLTKKMRLENGAKECIVQISARAFQRVFTCKNRRRYSRERADLILINFSSLQLFNFDRGFFTAQQDSNDLSIAMRNPCAHAYFSIFLPSSQHLPPVPIPPLFLSLFGLGAPEATPKALKELDVASKRHSDKTSFV